MKMKAKDIQSFEDLHEWVENTLGPKLNKQSDRIAELEAEILKLKQSDLKDNEWCQEELQELIELCAPDKEWEDILPSFSRTEKAVKAKAKQLQDEGKLIMPKPKMAVRWSAKEYKILAQAIKNVGEDDLEKLAIEHNKLCARANIYTYRKAGGIDARLKNHRDQIPF